MALQLWSGVLLTLAAGVLSGNCMPPMKFARYWPWEAIWLVFSVVSLVILSWAFAVAEVTQPQLRLRRIARKGLLCPPRVRRRMGHRAGLIRTVYCAARFLALGYAIIIGLGALLGTLVPLFVNGRDVVDSARGALIFSGVTIMVVGIAISARAGLLRERKQCVGTPGRGCWFALALAALCGFMAPMLNYAFAFGQSIAGEAIRHGAVICSDP